MIYYDGKIYRNLEEQVLKNQKDIEIYSAGGNFDLKGIVDGFDDLPESPQEGDYYLVGTGVPYQLYLYYYNSWINLGDYPKEGPQGPQGIAGQDGATGPRGPQGPKGDSLVYEILDIVASTSDLPDPDSVDYWDAYLVGSDIPYMAYFVINGEWTPVGYITPQEAENVVTADSTNSGIYKVMMSAQSGTRKIAESAWSITSTVVDTPNLIPSSQAVVDYVQNQVSAAVKFKGTLTFAQLSALASAELGDLYNISDSFTLSGVSYDAGTNLVCVTAFSSAITPSDTYWDAYGEAAMDLSPYMKSYTGDPTQWDTTPTASSTKPVTSGGIESAISSAVSAGVAGKQDTLTYSSTPQIGYIHLYEYDETQSDGSDGVLENVDGNLYFNGSAVGGGGGGGIQNTATGIDAFAISPDDTATASGKRAISIGRTTVATNKYGIAIGDNARVDASSSIGSIAIGQSAAAGGSTCFGDIAIGRGAIAGTSYSDLDGCIAIGSGTSATETTTTGGANARAWYAISIGTQSSVPNGSNYGIAIGYNTTAKKIRDIVIGSNAQTSSSSSYNNNVVIGSFTSSANLTVSASNGIALGNQPKSIDHANVLAANNLKFVPLSANDSYTISSGYCGLLLNSSGTTYQAPSTTVTTSTEGALLILWAYSTS